MSEYQATGRYISSRGRSHTFNITTDSSDRNHIKDIVMSMYAARSVTVYNVRDLTYERVVKKAEDSFIPSFPSGPTFPTGDNEDIGVQYIRFFTRLLEITFFLLRISFFILKICWNVAFAISKFIYEVISNETNQERVKRIIRSIYNFLRKTLFNLGNWDKLGKFLSKKVSWTITRTNLFFKYFTAKLKSLFKKRSLNTLVEVSSNKNEETFKNKEANKFKNNPPIRYNFLPKSKKTINNFFIIFSIILSLIVGNEIRKSYPFYKADKKVPESKKSSSKIIKFKMKDRKYLKASIGGSEEIIFYFNRALDNERLGRYKEAIADYDLIAQIKISEMDYNYENALFYRAWLKIKNKKTHKGAIEDMEKLIIMNPNNIDLKIDLATFYSKNNKNKKAVQILDKAIEENPNEGNLYYWKGIYKNEYSYPSGCRYINKAKKLKASDWYPGPWPNC